MFLSITRMAHWGKGDHPLPFVLVDDVAEALVLARTAQLIGESTLLLTGPPLLSGNAYVQQLGIAIGTNVRSKKIPIWRWFFTDLFKEAVKHTIRHRNRRIPSFRDWKSRSHSSQYDSSKTQFLLGWKPNSNKTNFIELGINRPAKTFAAP